MKSKSLQLQILKFDRQTRMDLSRLKLKNQLARERIIRRGLQRLCQIDVPRFRQRLENQFCDEILLAWTPAYKTSRSLYLKKNGRFTPELNSIMRSERSFELTRNRIRYSPLEPELKEIASFANLNPDLIEPSKLLKFYFTPVFHEQNHRIIWTQMPRPAREQDLFFYLNLCESVCVTLDLILALQLPKSVADFFHFSGMHGQSGSISLRRTFLTQSQAERLESLWIFCFASFLNLNFFDEKLPLELLPTRTSLPSKTIALIVKEAFTMSPEFSARTNLGWQTLHQHKLKKFSNSQKGAKFKYNSFWNSPAYDQMAKQCKNIFKQYF